MAGYPVGIAYNTKKGNQSAQPAHPADAVPASEIGLILRAIMA
jgi:hypothetical protein